MHSVLSRIIMVLCFAALLADCAAVAGKASADDSKATSVTWVSEAVVCEADPLSGAEIIQLTNRPIISTNVHQEQRFASADGKRIAIQRRISRRQQEVWVCDLPTRRLCRIGEGRIVAANSHRDAVYYLLRDEEQYALMRLNLNDLTTRQLYRFSLKDRRATKSAVSPDERWFVRGRIHVRDNVYSLHVADLETGEERTLCEVEDMFNPHHQFDPSGSGRLVVQVNRGGSAPWRRDGRPLTGPEGSTLILVDVPSGKVTPLPVGSPDTARLSGHLCWIGQTGRILFTAAPGLSKSMMEGTGVYEVTPGNTKARRIVSGEPFNHIAASDDGRFFIVDNWKTQRIFVGSIKTGRFLPLCDSHTHQGRGQYTHAHPYMTPDNQYVIFNCSVERGVSQVYAARIPEGFLEKLLATEEKGLP